jgi:hypothetical protein
MTRQEKDDLQKDDKAIRAKDIRRKNYTMAISILAGAALTISASVSKDRATFILLFSTIIVAYVIGLGAAVIYVIFQRRRRLRDISYLFKQNRTSGDRRHRETCRSCSPGSAWR